MFNTSAIVCYSDLHACTYMYIYITAMRLIESVFTLASSTFSLMQLAQTVVDAGAVAHLAKLISSPDPKLKVCPPLVHLLSTSCPVLCLVMTPYMYIQYMYTHRPLFLLHPYIGIEDEHYLSTCMSPLMIIYTIDTIHTLAVPSSWIQLYTYTRIFYSACSQESKFYFASYSD